ncbi:wiskott-Aldrich syndrome protein homolog 1-like [Triticum aestivum]|uniref:wiskott-Aldrich syndrome protein homolog 1-like n=1 Tax=Triticum aestivum TaxID=4565 RepID=UPI001D013B88|nr:wiskott-Aldrich syndrome protein homolog 1-like [Triticum aestivum]
MPPRSPACSSRARDLAPDPSPRPGGRSPSSSIPPDGQVLASRRLEQAASAPPHSVCVAGIASRPPPSCLSSCETRHRAPPQAPLLLCVTLLLCFSDDLSESPARAPSVPSPGSRCWCPQVPAPLPPEQPILQSPLPLSCPASVPPARLCTRGNQGIDERPLTETPPRARERSKAGPCSFPLPANRASSPPPWAKAHVYFFPVLLLRVGSDNAAFATTATPAAATAAGPSTSSLSFPVPAIDGEDDDEDVDEFNGFGALSEYDAGVTEIDEEDEKALAAFMSKETSSK